MLHFSEIFQALRAHVVFPSCAFIALTLKKQTQLPPCWSEPRCCAVLGPCMVGGRRVPCSIVGCLSDTGPKCDSRILGHMKIKMGSFICVHMRNLKYWTISYFIHRLKQKVGFALFSNWAAPQPRMTEEKRIVFLIPTRNNYPHSESNPEVESPLPQFICGV